MINPPTDNLYKFCAIVGLFLIIFNSYYNMELLIETGNELTKLIGDQKKYSIELSIHEKKRIVFSEKLKIAVAQKEDLIKNQKKLLSLLQTKRDPNQIKELDSEVEKATQESYRITKSLDSLNELQSKEYNSLQLKEVEIETKHQLIKRQEIRADIYSKYMWTGVILGFILSFFGFFNWYKIQKKMDMQN